MANIDFKQGIIQGFSLLSILMFLSMSYFVVINDIKTQKIPNKLLLTFLYIGVGMYSLFFSYGIFSGNQFVINYVKIVAINVPIAAIVGYVFWYFDLWSPGDGKYFPLVVMFLPIQFYQYQYIAFFPPLVVLINSYVLGFILIVCYVTFIMLKRVVNLYKEGFYTKEYFLFVKGNIKSKASDKKYIFNLIGTVLYMASMLIVIRTVFDYAANNTPYNSANSNLMMVLIMYFGGMKIINAISRNKNVYRMSYLVFVSVVIFQYVVLEENIFFKLYDMLIASFFVIIIIPLAKKMIEEYQRVTEVLKVEEIRMGVELSEEAVLAFMNEKNIVVPANVPLTDDQAQIIKDNFPNMMQVRSITHITFGPFLFLGAVFVMLFQKTIVHYL